MISIQADSFRRSFVRTIICLLTSISFSSCEMQEELPNGFAIKRRDTGKYEIVGPTYTALNGVRSSSSVVGPDVMSIAVFDDLVVGFRDGVEEADGFNIRSGYFLLNTNSGKSEEITTLNELERILESQYQIYKDLDLKPIYRY